MTKRKVAAGILPKSGDYYLLGLENSTHPSRSGWCPFAGGGDNNETPYETACREAFEESCRLLHKNNFINVRCIVDFNKYNEFYLFIVDLKNNIDINKFSTNLKKESDPYFKEKSEIQWFHKSMLRNISLRKSFLGTLDSVLNIK
tara:strand:- start:288 stop:722 length:435 start_codon:yes stop_codon:yes gene_type:complete